MTPRLDSATGPSYTGGIVFLRGQFDPDKAISLEIYEPPMVSDAHLWQMYDVTTKFAKGGLRHVYISGADGDPKRWAPIRPNSSSQVVLHNERLLSFQLWIYDNMPRCFALRVRQDKEISNTILLNQPELWFARGQDENYRAGESFQVFGRCLAPSAYGQDGRFFLAPLGSPSKRVELENRPAFSEFQGASLGAADSCRYLRLPKELEDGPYVLWNVMESSVFGVSNSLKINVGPRPSPEWFKLDAASQSFSAELFEKDVEAVGIKARETGVRQLIYLATGIYQLDRTLRLPPGVGLVGQGRDTILTNASKFTTEWATPPWMGIYNLSALLYLQGGCSLRDITVRAHGEQAPVAAVAIWHTVDGPNANHAVGVAIERSTLSTASRRAYEVGNNPPHPAAALVVHAETTGLLVSSCDLEGTEGVTQMAGCPAQDFVISGNRFKPLSGGRVGTTAFGGLWGNRGVVEYNTAEDVNRGFILQSWAGPVSQMAIVGNVFRGGLTHYGQGESCLLEFTRSGMSEVDSAKVPCLFEAQAVVLRDATSPPFSQALKNAIALVVSGPGRGQWRRISAVSSTGDKAMFNKPWDTTLTQDSRVILGNIAADLFFFGNRYENAKGGLMIDGRACGIVSVADEWFQSRDGIYLDSKQDSSGVFDLTFIQPTLVNSAFSLLNLDGDQANDIPVVSGVVVHHGLLVNTPIYWAARAGLEGLALTESDFDNYWGQPGYPYVRSVFRLPDTIMAKEDVPFLVLDKDGQETKTVRFNRCRRNQVPVERSTP
jgi:hypothetical protein